MLGASCQASEDTARTCQSALSTCRHVPAELLEIIFSALCLSLHEYSLQIKHDDEEKTPTISTPTLALSQVCSRWRAIARASPRLWSSISVEITELPLGIDAVLELYFTYADSHPLNFRIVRVYDTLAPQLSLGDRAIWRVISTRITRCKSLTLGVSHLDLPEITNLSFPHLESFLQESAIRGTGDDEVMWLWRAIGEAPRLTKAGVWNVNRMLPYSQLTSLSLHFPMAEQVLLLFEVLPTCTRLVDLSLRCVDLDIDPSAFEPVEVPASFRKLSIHHKGYFSFRSRGSILSTIFHNLRMPSLVSFEMECLVWPPSIQVLAEHSPLIQRVDLTLCASDKYDLTPYPPVQFLRSMPNVTYLDLSTQLADSSSVEDEDEGEDEEEKHRSLSFGDRLLSTVLFSFAAESTFFPKLEVLSLRLSDVSLDSETVEKVLAAVSARYSSFGCHPLKEIRVSPCPRDASNANRPQLESVVGSGIDQRLQEAAGKIGVKLVML
ncbi:hypothetical protein V5O48_015898 [Marasmius crinis-equi]|uniref:F-box domain-containing protein n=1 Tax=Marasmius crinis-equi TaxID=585013 RepID=A0ABR3ET78_9AGAR